GEAAAVRALRGRDENGRPLVARGAAQARGGAAQLPQPRVRENNADGAADVHGLDTLSGYIMSTPMAWTDSRLLTCLIALSYMALDQRNWGMTVKEMLCRPGECTRVTNGAAAAVAQIQRPLAPVDDDDEDDADQDNDGGANDDD
ncbi:hypothetical protein DXG03_004447, partial [Asterophora parasitica]